MVKNPPANAGDKSSVPGLENTTGFRATKPMSHNYWACSLEPRNHNYWAHVLQLLKPTHPKAHAVQQEKPPWETHALQPETCPHLLQLEKARAKQQKPSTAKIKNKQATPQKKKWLIWDILEVQLLENMIEI